MDRLARIYVAGHRGLVGSAIEQRLRQLGYDNLVLRTHCDLDLTDMRATDAFFAEYRPEYVFLAAAKVGGILANETYPADFIRENLLIQTSVIDAATRHDVKRLLFLGSSCIYPKFAAQPLNEASLLGGELEPTNQPYAVAKIAGIEMCASYNRQYGTAYLAVMPTNLYGPGDNYHAENSHVIPALIRRFHDAKEASVPEVVIWGTGSPRREFLFNADMADACVFLMNLDDAAYQELINPGLENGRRHAPIINIGVGEDLSIAELAALIAETVGYGGKLVYDCSKPDGTPRKLLDVGRLHELGWRAHTSLRSGLRQAYAAYVATLN